MTRKVRGVHLKSPGTPGREAEDVPVDAKTQSSPDPVAI